MPELDDSIGEHGRGGLRERAAVEGEGADQAAVDPADPAGQRDQPAELPDHVGEDEGGEGRGAAEGGECGGEGDDVERHVAD